MRVRVFAKIRTCTGKGMAGSCLSEMFQSVWVYTRYGYTQDTQGMGIHKIRKRHHAGNQELELHSLFT